jgi:hypothetical protein
MGPFFNSSRNPSSSVGASINVNPSNPGGHRTSAAEAIESAQGFLELVTGGVGDNGLEA